MSLRRQIPAGLIDSGAASVATFAVGLYAVRYLDENALGVYALLFTVFLLAPTIAQSLVFVPANVVALSLPERQRSRLYRQTISVGVGPAILAGLIVILAVLPAASAVEPEELWALALTAAAASVVSPLQDNMRRLLYLGGRATYVAIVSLTQVAVTVAVLVLALTGDIPHAWVPFGALTLANVMSSVVAVALSEWRAEDPPRGLLQIRQLVKSGRWFLIGNLAPNAAAFLAALVVLTLAGPDVLGQSEAARVAARPLTVFVLGISAVITPQAMQAGRDRDKGTARRLTRNTDLLVLIVGLGYLAVAGFSWPGNAIERLVPRAYDVPWLAAVAIVAAAMTSALISERAQLTGGGEEVALARIETAGSVLILLGALTADVTLAFALFIGQIARAVVRWIGFRRACRRLFAESAAARPPPDA